MSLRINKGNRIGFIGITGSGKSTLLDLIMGLLTPTEGSINIDGKPIDSENCRAWQRHIAHVPQHIFLVDASIAENIAFGIPLAEFDFDRVRTAAQHARIAPLTTLNRLLFSCRHESTKQRMFEDHANKKNDCHRQQDERGAQIT